MNLPFFAVKAYVPGGVQNQAEKNSKNAFRPVPVQKFTFPEFWEVLNGVGVDGVGIFPFSSFFFAFLRFSSLFFAFLRFSSFFFVFRLFSWNKGKRLQFTGRMGNFAPTPSAPTPCGTSRHCLSRLLGQFLVVFSQIDKKKGDQKRTNQRKTNPRSRRGVYPSREERSVHDHHRKKIFCGTFLASKKNFPGWWWIQKTL